jgi:trehalose 6-phosphate synthase/phosphatase
VKGKLIVVSNRGPYRLSRTAAGGWKRVTHVGGLVTSILPVMKKQGGVWVAWGDPEGRYTETAGRAEFTVRQIRLSAEQEHGFYWGLSNTALWPLCHSFLGRVRYEPDDWKMYVEVNRIFAEKTVAEMEEGDEVWVHDFQLAMVPKFIREARPSARLAFFWHIPFPATEIYRTFPWRSDLLQSLLACDLVGFHIPEYRENFSEAAAELLGAGVEGETVRSAGRRTRTIALPIGIDYQEVERVAKRPRTLERVRELKAGLPGQTILLGVERMDYTKGILERLRAMESLLEKKPEYRGAVTLIQIVTPSREFVSAYQQKRREIDEIVGRINGRFSSDQWIPIRYLFRSFTRNRLIEYYCLSDIALVTPLRDGLNLVAKEFVASRLRCDGVMILSEFAGVAWQLPEAILVNPYNEEDMCDAIDRAIRLPKAEQERRMRSMQDRVRVEDFNWWITEFLNAMEHSPPDAPAWPEALFMELREGRRPWLFLDYDGTLVPIARAPHEAVPDAELLALLARLAKATAFRTVLLSGRPLADLKQIADGTGLTLAGLYGLEVQLPDGRVIRRADPDAVRPVVERIRRAWSDRIGSREGFLLEDKGLSIALHARFADPSEAADVLEAARRDAEPQLAEGDLRLLGGDRFLEAAPAEADKRLAVDWLIDRFAGGRAYPVYFGDDDKDEEAFDAVRCRGGLPVIVGNRQERTRALLRLNSPGDVRMWLEDLLAFAAGQPKIPEAAEKKTVIPSAGEGPAGSANTGRSKSTNSG